MKLTADENFLATLNARFEKYKERHKAIDWKSVEEKLKRNSIALKILQAMDATGGEPDVIKYDKKADQYLFCDCSEETPSGRRSLCYDREALNKRKENKPAGSAIELAQKIGIKLLTEVEYRELQELGEFDKKTSSWIDTPKAIRQLGGALFCDRRYDHVFTYHNGADSYYAARGFRGKMTV